MKSDNDYIAYYGENKISPVNQNISDFKLHLRRRQKLYRQCGIPTFAFRNAEMLEVGPGGGHNALAPLSWGIRHIDLVEPNATGVNIIKKLFNEHAISEDRYSIHNMPIEQYAENKKYDIVVAEGFLMYIKNWREVCETLATFVNIGGVLVVACADDVSGFVELMKRMIGQIIVQKCQTLDKKVEALIPVFEPQLAKLRGVSRPAKDWIQDNIFNPALSRDYAVSMLELIDFYDSGFDVIGCSPRMFTDYSWYKDIWFDELSDYRRQFAEKRTTLAMAGMSETIIDENMNTKITALMSKAKKLENEWENTGNTRVIAELSDVLYGGENTIREYMPKMFVEVYEEICDAIKCLSVSKVPDMCNYEHFFQAFGRNEQYVGFMRIM